MTANFTDCRKTGQIQLSNHGRLLQKRRGLGALRQPRPVPRRRRPVPAGGGEVGARGPAGLLRQAPLRPAGLRLPAQGPGQVRHARHRQTALAVTLAASGATASLSRPTSKRRVTIKSRFIRCKFGSCRVSLDRRIVTWPRWAGRRRPYHARQGPRGGEVSAKC